MVTEINCYDDNISNMDICTNTYYVCSSNCVLSSLIFVIGFLWCGILCCYYSFKKRKGGGIYADLYTRELEPQNLYTEPEYEEDQGLIIRGRNIYNSPPKYSEN